MGLWLENSEAKGRMDVLLSALPLSEWCRVLLLELECAFESLEGW